MQKLVLSYAITISSKVYTIPSALSIHVNMDLATYIYAAILYYSTSSPIYACYTTAHGSIRLAVVLVLLGLSGHNTRLNATLVFASQDLKEACTHDMTCTTCQSKDKH